VRNTTPASSYVFFPEGSLARVHYIIGRYEGTTPIVERAALEAGITAIAESWGDKLRAALAISTDGMRARMLANRYAQAFSGGYTEVFDASQAIADIAAIEKLSPDRPVAISRARTIRRASTSRFSRVARPCRCPTGCR
jgi:glutamate dehydrogenase